MESNSDTKTEDRRRVGLIYDEKDVQAFHSRWRGPSGEPKSHPPHLEQAPIRRNSPKVFFSSSSPTQIHVIMYVCMQHSEVVEFFFTIRSADGFGLRHSLG